MDSHGSSLETAVVHGVCTIWTRKLPSNLLSRAYIKQILTLHPESFLRSQGKGLCVCALHLHRREGAGTKESPNLTRKPLKFCQIELTATLETQRVGSHSIWHVVPSIVPFEILLVGGETICRVG